MSKAAQGNRAATAAPNPATDGGSSETATPSPTEIAAAQAHMGTVVTRNEQAMQTFVGWCVEKATGTDEDSYAMAASIIADILSGENAEDVLTERAPLHARDILNVPILLHGFEIREGDYEESEIGYYAALTVTKSGSDTTRVVTCGATKVLAKLYMLDQFGEWPQLVWFTEKKTKKGYGVLDIVRPEFPGLRTQ